MNALGEQGYRTHQVEAAGSRHEQYGVNTDAMTEGRGMTP